MEKIKIGDRLIGEDEPVFIIAEIGSNHDGYLDQAKELIKASAEAGANAVKFQSFSAENLLNRRTFENGTLIDDPAYAILEELALADEWHEELLDYAKSQRIIFLSTPFDETKAELLASLGVEAFKIASGDLTYVQLLRKVANYQRPIILSTGHATMDEIKEAVAIIEESGNNRIILMHCVSLYPPRPCDLNLRAINKLSKEFELPVGFSDHSLDDSAALGAVALGANAIEKHFTLDKNSHGPDHSFAMEPVEFANMVRRIRALEAALGYETKKPAEAELSERTDARRGLYARKKVKKGDKVQQDAIKIVRPHRGISPKELDKIIGMIVTKDFEEDEPIGWEEINNGLLP